MFRCFNISKNRFKSIELLKARFLFKVTICDLERKWKLFWGVILIRQVMLWFSPLLLPKIHRMMGGESHLLRRVREFYY